MKRKKKCQKEKCRIYIDSVRSALSFSVDCENETEMFDCFVFAGDYWTPVYDVLESSRLSGGYGLVWKNREVSPD